MYKTFIESEEIASGRYSESWLLDNSTETTLIGELGGLYRLPEQALVIDGDLNNSPILF
ncbi:MAG: hypothetical protein ABI333_10155 [bacterium]